MIALRDYQQYIYDSVRNAIRNGSRGILVCLPCRSGKSYIMASMIEHLRYGYALVLAHRRELLRQHQKLLAPFGSRCRLESVFTEVNRVSEHEPPTLILIDEAHLSEASSYRKVCDAYPDALRIGFTATPQRLSGERLSLFDTLIQGISTKELIGMGAISEFDYYAPAMHVSLEGIDSVAGDYNNRELADRMCNSRLYGDYIDAYIRLAVGKQALAYCVSKKHAKQVCRAFNEAGIPAAEIDSSDPVKERMRVLDAFKDNEFSVLCNVGLLSEGMTLPEADVCLLLRPTQSLALYIQQAMRCLTPREGKRAVIIDCVENVLRHGLPDEEHQWSLDGKVTHRVSNIDGTFSIRTCSECFRVYSSRQTVCPYCGTPYVVKGRELKQVQDIEYAQIKKEEAEKLKEVRKKMRMEVGRARTKEELWKIAKQRGYSAGWVYHMIRVRGGQ